MVKRSDKLADKLHEAIDEDPDLEANYVVLADHLIEQGDPRGELIHLAIQGRKRTKDGLARFEKLEAKLGPSDGDFDWQRGYVRTWRPHMAVDSQSDFRKLLDHPSLRHLTALEFTFSGSFHDKRQWLVDVLAERSHPALRTLTITGNEPELTDLSLAKLWKKLPRIEHVRANARFITIGTLTSNTLVTLHLDAGIDGKDLKPLLTANVPALRELGFEAAAGTWLDNVRASPLAKRLKKKLVVRPLDTDRYDRFVE